MRNFFKTQFAFVGSIMIVMLLSSCFASDSIPQYLLDWEDELQDTQPESSTLNLLDNLAWDYRKHDFAKALAYGQQELELATELGNLPGMSNGWNRIGNALEDSGAYDQALDAYKEALALDQQQESLYGVGRDLHQIAVVYRKMGAYQNGIDYALRSIKTLKQPPFEEKRERVLGNVYNNLGLLYKNQGNYVTSLEFFQKGLKLREELGDPKGVAKSYNEIGLLYFDWGTFASALSKSRSSLQIALSGKYQEETAIAYSNMGNAYLMLGNLDSADYCFDQSLEFHGSGPITSAKVDVIHNQGVVFHARKDYSKALEYFQQALELRKKMGYQFRVAESYLNIGELNLEQGKYSAALDSLTAGLAVAEHSQYLPLKSQILALMADVYINMQDADRALVYYSAAKQLSDSLDAIRNQAIDVDRKITHNRYNEDRFQDIVALQEAKSNLKTLGISALSIGLILLIIIIVAYGANARNKQRAVIAEQNVRISRDEIDDLLQTQELKLMRAMLEGQDEERQRLSADLHDRLGGILSVVRLHFKSVEKNIHQMETQNQEQYAKATELLNEACDTVRTISHDIGDSLLLNLGLVPALEDLASTIEASKELTVSVIHHGLDDRLDSSTEIDLYKIVQELLSNILKHAAARHVTISLTKNEDRLSMMVEDDGVGFEFGSSDNREGIGLFSIRSRVEKLSGEFDLDSTVGHGTTASVDIPISTQ